MTESKSNVRFGRFGDWALCSWLETMPGRRSTTYRVLDCALVKLSFRAAIRCDVPGKIWDEALRAAHFTPVTLVCSYLGEDYADIPTVRRAVGLVPEATRSERIVRTKAVADVGKELGVDSIACHIGFVPEEPSAATLRRNSRRRARHLRPLRQKRPELHARDRAGTGPRFAALHGRRGAAESENQFRSGQHDSCTARAIRSKRWACSRST